MNTLQTAITQLHTTVHYEMSVLKADIVNQFEEQATIIRRQQELIEQLMQLVQQKR